jgi:Beta-lactamase enzyme family
VRRRLGVVLVVLSFLAPVSAARAAGVPSANSVTGFGDGAGLAAKAPAASKPLVGIAAAPGGGYWLAARDGGVFAYGAAPFKGSLGGMQLNAPIVGIAAYGDGYALAASDGGVFVFGNGPFRGSLGSLRLNAPIVAIAPYGDGYALAASDGGVFVFGNGPFRGSLGGLRLNRPVVGMATTAPGRGYWLVASDGGVFAFGAPFHGSLGSLRLNQPIVGMSATATGNGYWLAADDGGVFALGQAPFHGSDGGAAVTHPAVGIATAGNGYWIAYGRTALGPRIAAYAATRSNRVTAAVFDAVTGELSVFNPAIQTFTASTLEVDILATLLATRPLTDRDRSMAGPMIQESANAPASAFWSELGKDRVTRFQQATGMTATTPPGDGTWGRTLTTALDRIAMMRHVAYASPLLTDGQRAYILSLMESVVPSQRWGATGGVPGDAPVALKNGFVGQQINTMGWVRGHSRDYLIAVLTDGNPSWDYGIETTNAVSAMVWSALAP